MSSKDNFNISEQNEKLNIIDSANINNIKEIKKRKVVSVGSSTKNQQLFKKML